MANSLFIKIELPSETEESTVAGGGTGSTGGAVSGWGASKKSGDGAGDQIMKAAKRMVTFAAVKSTADTLVNHRINTVSLRTGATEYEQRLSLQYNTASQIVGAGASLVIGGMTGGPAGIVIAAMGIAVSGMHKAISIAQKEDTLRTQESLENISIGMATVRAGVSGRRSKNQ